MVLLYEKRLELTRALSLPNAGYLVNSKKLVGELPLKNGSLITHSKAEL